MHIDEIKALTPFQRCVILLLEQIVKTLKEGLDESQFVE